MKINAQIDLIWIRLRELELAVDRILRLLNEWHQIEEPFEEEENTRVGLPGIQPITKSTTHNGIPPKSAFSIEMGV